MMHIEKDGLMVVNALHQSSLIETDVPTREVAAALSAGTVVIVKNAFVSREMVRLRALINAAQIPICERSFDNDTKSWRDRREERENRENEILLESSFFAVSNPDDRIGQTMCETVERLAAYWRALTGAKHTFVAKSDRRALRPWAMYYPAGGGCFGWHEHLPEPTKIGITLALSKIGVDFHAGGAEFRTPFGVIDVMPYHDIGDICLFRYDLPHRVTSVDPDRNLLWDGSGRWTLIIQCDPRPASSSDA